MPSSTSSTPMIQSLPDRGLKVDAAKIAKPFRDEIKQKVEKFKSSGVDAPLLVGLLANKDPAARQYAEWTGKACRADGIRYELKIIDDEIDVERVLVECNNNPSIHGIIVYYPIFGQQQTFSGSSQDDYLRDSISPTKDVEGLCHLYRTNLYRNVRYLDAPSNTQKCLLPCTALSVVKLLEQCSNCYDFTKIHGKQLVGKTVTVINRSEIVGRPLAAMLANDGATVYSVDISSIYLFANNTLQHVSDSMTVEQCVRSSNIVITGVPTKSYRLDCKLIQPHTVLVNVASYKNVDEEELLKIPGVIYIPQVGKVTVAMLERNLMRLYENFHSQKKQTRKKWWYDSPVQLYTAIAVTVLLAVELMRK